MSRRPTAPARKSGPKKGPQSNKPKSYKSDGTAKKRWSSSERAERGHAPRRSGGRPRTDRQFEGAPRGRFEGQRDGGDRRFDDRNERNDRFEKRNSDRGGRNFERADRAFDRQRDRDQRDGGFDRGDRRRDFSDRRDFDRRGGNDRRDFSDRRDDRRSFDRPQHDRPRYDRRDNERREGRRDFSDRRSFDRRDGERREDRRDFSDRRSFDRRDGDRRDFRGGRDFGGRRDFERRDDRRDFGRGERRDFDRGYADRDEFDNEADTMSWDAGEAVEVDAASVADDASFAQLGVAKPLVAQLQSQGITTPFPIQAATIPDALSGRDVLGRGQTGSGKTLGFGLPMLSRLAEGPTGGHGRVPRGMVLVPTRELALQVADVLSPLAQTIGLSVTLIAGGMAYGPQIKAFDRGVDIVVATPGRLIDLLEQGTADLSGVEVAVLDEADHMADLGFMPAVSTILDAIPEGGQRLLFSATLDRGVDRLVKKYLNDPVTHQVDSDQASVSTMEHVVMHVLPHDKNATTAAVANREGRSVIFVRTQRGADRVAEQLRAAGVMAGALHGGLTQGARTRILAAFKSGDVPVLVATDVAARGIHVDDVSLVLQADPPMGPKDYLHRAGRTARAGGTGVVASIVLPHQRKEMFRLTKQAGVKTQPVELRPGDADLARLTGARVPEGGSISEETYRDLIAPPKPQRRNRNFSGGGRGNGRGPGRGGQGRGYGRGQGRGRRG